jgi:hypothetical protein
MRFIPSIIALDFETALWDGSPSIDFFRHDFEITSCAIAYRDANGDKKSKDMTDTVEIRHFLTQVRKEKIPLVVFNYHFEYGCLKCQLPEFADLHVIDAMRLAQLTDNGGKDFVLEMEKTFEDIYDELEGNKPIAGMSLEACVSRLGDKQFYRHKRPYQTLLVERGGDKASFELLTKDELATYNKLDAIVTLDLYERVTATLKERGIDWGMDHDLYLTMCRLTADAKIRGVIVDRERAAEHIALKASELASIERRFRERFSTEIEEIEAEMAKTALGMYKSEKGREAAAKRIEADPPRFNVNSTKQLKCLFCGKLGLKPKFLTKTGEPSFASKLMFQWGDGGEILSKRGRAMIEKAQGEALVALSEYDGSWHVSIKVTGARSGRMSGG